MLGIIVIIAQHSSAEPETILNKSTYEAKSAMVPFVVGVIFTADKYWTQDVKWIV